MLPPLHLVPSSAMYPARLRALPHPPEIWLSQELAARRTVAIVGTRTPTPDAESFAEQLARSIAQSGGIVVSGGALGIDAAAHRGALAAAGGTWVVNATGCDHAYPPENGTLFHEIAKSPTSALIWPFAPQVAARLPNFFLRNGVLVALADAVVIVQASIPSGALNAAAWARRLGRPLWAVPAPPWTVGFEGCRSEIERGALPLVRVEPLLKQVGLVRAHRRSQTLAKPPLPAPRELTADETLIFAELSGTPTHVDALLLRTALPVGRAMTALLTLGLEHVVVEGPVGHYRRESF